MGDAPDFRLIDHTKREEALPDLIPTVVDIILTITEELINNVDLLIDIISQTFLMIFQKLDDDELKATRLNIGLTNNSICSVLHQFIEDCGDDELHWESPEKLLKSLQTVIRKRIMENSE